jgi:ribosome modulation factor
VVAAKAFQYKIETSAQFNQGSYAFYMGIAERDNPFCPRFQPALYKAWLAGWNGARIESETA